MGEDEDVSQLVERFISSKYQFYDRKRVKGVENFIYGAQIYLNLFNEGESKSDVVEHI